MINDTTEAYFLIPFVIVSHQNIKTYKTNMS